MIPNNLPPLTDYKCIFCNEKCIKEVYYYKCENCSKHSLTTYSLRDGFYIHEIHLYNEELQLVVYYKYFYSRWEEYSSKLGFKWESDEDGFNALTPITFREMCDQYIKLRAFW